MERIISIDGKAVGFKATASTIRRYREKFNSDFLKDIQNISANVGVNGEMSAEDLATFERIAYTMAWQYDSTIPDIDEWLDQFEMFSIYLASPQIVELWHLNAITLEEPKKKVEEQSGN